MPPGPEPTCWAPQDLRAEPRFLLQGGTEELSPAALEKRRRRKQERDRRKRKRKELRANEKAAQAAEAAPPAPAAPSPAAGQQTGRQTGLLFTKVGRAWRVRVSAGGALAPGARVRVGADGRFSPRWR